MGEASYMAGADVADAHVIDMRPLEVGLQTEDAAAAAAAGAVWPAYAAGTDGSCREGLAVPLPLGFAAASLAYLPAEGAEAALNLGFSCGEAAPEQQQALQRLHR